MLEASAQSKRQPLQPKGREWSATPSPLNLAQKSHLEGHTGR